MCYVDKNKVSHVDSNVIDNILKKNEEITITRVMKHTFLGMNLHIKEAKTIQI